MFFNDPRLIAVISDASIDFTPGDFDSPLAPPQRAYLQKACGVDIPQVFWREQVHGDDIVEASGEAASAKNAPDADAYITNQPGLPIAIRTADCVPVFIFDPARKAIGLAHAGWKGAQKGIAAKVVKRMQDKFGSRCYDLKVALGPAIRSCCYQVGEEFQVHFPRDVAQRHGRLYADMAAVNRRQLMEAGVRAENIMDSGVCTCCGKNYFSFRRDGKKAGRMISLMMLR